MIRSLLWMLLCLLLCSVSHFSSAETLLDMAYGPDPLQRLDIYRPEGAKEKLPAVLWIHGGGWTEGDKRTGANGIGALAATLTGRRFVAVSCNYRLAPSHRYPDPFDDVQRAVRWLRAHADTYGIDPDRIAAVGISAGGHLACLLGVRETRAPPGDELDRYSSRVQAVVCLNGPTDLRPAPELVTPGLALAVANLVGPDPEEAAVRRTEASPVRYAAKDAAPALFIVGTTDPLVPNAHARRMADALREKGVSAEVLPLEGAGHGIFPSITPRATTAILAFLAGRFTPP